MREKETTRKSLLIWIDFVHQYKLNEMIQRWLYFCGSLGRLEVFLVVWTIVVWSPMSLQLNRRPTVLNNVKLVANFKHFRFIFVTWAIFSPLYREKKEDDKNRYIFRHFDISTIRQFDNSTVPHTIVLRISSIGWIIHPFGQISRKNVSFVFPCTTKSDPGHRSSWA